MRRLLISSLIALAAATPSSVLAETRGTGDFEFYLDVAGFRADDGSTFEEVYIRISNARVRFEESKGAYVGKVRVKISIQNDQGKTIKKEQLDVGMLANSETEATSPLVFQTVIKEYKLAPGQYQISCRVEDLYAPKVTVVGMVRGAVRSSRVDRYPFEVPDFNVEDIVLSDAKFIWAFERTPKGVIDHPNPSRVYGLHLDSLRVYFEAYVPKQMLEGHVFELETVIFDENGEPVKRSSIALPEPDEKTRVVGKTVVYPVIVTEDLNRFPAGAYSLYINAGLEDHLLVRMRSGRFSVAWDMRAWEVSQRNYLAEARFLLDREDYDEFAHKSLGEQEAALQAMWKEIDPDPATGVNEAHEAFLGRLKFVNASYSDFELGFLTDRGLIYLKYGPPDELIQDVMPLNRESMSDALQKVDDRFHSVNFSNTGGRLGYARPSRNIIIDPQRMGAVGEGGNTAFPYELWVYNDKGDPLLERDRNLEQDMGLRFFFVDRNGYGRYKLEASSSMANK